MPKKKKDRNEYMREYRKKNPQKIKTILERYWKKKLLEERSENEKA